MATLSSRLVLSLDNRVSPGLRQLSAQLGAFQARNRAMAASIIPGGGIGRLAGMVAGYAALSGTIRGTVGAAIGFESAMADVKKVVETTPEGFRELEKSVIDLSKRIPVAATGLAEIMASAGQSGIAVGDLGKFTELTARASIALGMTNSEVADLFPKLKNVFQLDMSGLGDLADGANHLSNRFAASAENILNFTNRAAGASKALNLSVAELQATGAGMVASGIVPETAARGINALATRLAVGSPKISKAFETMGWSFGEWRKLRDENGPKAMSRLFEEVSKLDKDQAAEAWKALAGQDFSDDFSKLRPEVVGRAFDAMADAQGRAGSVAQEYAVRANTTGNALQLLRNNVSAIGVEIGSRVLPALAAGATRLSTDLASLGTSTDDVFSRIGAAWQGLSEGLGTGDLFGGIKEQFAALERFIFGAGADGGLTQITDRFRKFGSALSAVASGDLGKLGALATSLSDLGAAVTGFGAAGTALALTGITTALRAAAGALGAVIFGTAAGRMFALAFAIQTIVEAIQKSGSIGEFVDQFSGSSWANIGLTAAGAAVGVMTLAKSVRALAGASKAVGAAGAPLAKILKGRAGKAGVGIAAAGGLAAWLFGGSEANASEAQAAPLTPRAAPKPGPMERNDLVLNSFMPGYIGAAKGALGIGGLDTAPIDANKSVWRQAWAYANGKGFKPQGENENDAQFAARQLGREILSTVTGWANWFGPGKGGWAVSGISYADMLADIRIKEAGPKQEPGATGVMPADEAAKMRAMTSGRAMRPTTSVPAVAAAPRLLTPQAAPLPAFTPAPVPSAPLVAAPDAVARETVELEKLLSVAQRVGDLRAEATGPRGFRASSLSADQSSEMAGLKMQLDEMTAGLPAVAAQVDAFIAAIQSGSPAVAAAADAIRQALTDAGVQGGQQLTQGIQSGVNTSVAALNGMGSRMFASGATAVGQLAAGMRSKQAEVSAAATAIAGSVAAKFPASPAKEGPLRFLPLMGGKIVQQLAGGMTAGPASAAASRIAAIIGTGISPSGAAVGGGVGPSTRAPSTITVNVGGITVTGGSNATETADQVMAAMNARLGLVVRSVFGDVV